MNINLYGHYKVSIIGDLAEIEPVLPPEWGQGTERSIFATGPDGMFDALSRERTRADGGRILSVGADIIREKFTAALDANAAAGIPLETANAVHDVLMRLRIEILGVPESKGGQS